MIKMTMRSFVDLGTRLHRREMHCYARTSRSAQECNFGGDREVIGAKKENEEEEWTGRERERGRNEGRREKVADVKPPARSRP